jgi:hypothetical protein
LPIRVPTLQKAWQKIIEIIDEDLS